MNTTINQTQSNLSTNEVIGFVTKYRKQINGVANQLDVVLNDDTFDPISAQEINKLFLEFVKYFKLHEDEAIQELKNLTKSIDIMRKLTPNNGKDFVNAEEVIFLWYKKYHTTTNIENQNKTKNTKKLHIKLEKINQKHKNRLQTYQEFLDIHHKYIEEYNNFLKKREEFIIKDVYPNHQNYLDQHRNTIERNQEKIKKIQESLEYDQDTIKNLQDAIENAQKAIKERQDYIIDIIFKSGA